MTEQPQSIQVARPPVTVTEAASNRPPTIGDDLLRGADEIARFLFGSEVHRRKIYYLTGDAKVRMPHFRIGTALCARKITLLAWVERQEGI